MGLQRTLLCSNTDAFLSRMFLPVLVSSRPSDFFQPCLVNVVLYIQFLEMYTATAILAFLCDIMFATFPSCFLKSLYQCSYLLLGPCFSFKACILGEFSCNSKCSHADLYLTIGSESSLMRSFSTLAWMCASFFHIYSPFVQLSL